MHICIQSSEDGIWTWDLLIIIWQWSTFFVGIAEVVGSNPTRSTFYCEGTTVLDWAHFRWLSDKLITFRYDSVLFSCMSTPTSDSTLYRCEVCNESFNSQQEIERHNKEKHVETAGQKE